MLFIYEDKHLTQHWTMHNWRIRRLVVCKTQNMHIPWRWTF